MVVNIDRSALEDRFGELEQRHVRPTPRPVNGKKTKPAGLQTVEMAVAVGEQLIGALGGGVQGNWMLDRVIDAEWQFAVGAVHRTARRVDQLRGLKMPAGFQYIQKPDEVRLRVGIRVVQGITNACLSGQVHHLGEPMGFEQRHQGRLIDNVHGVETETLQFTQLLEPCLFEFDAVVMVEVVDANNFMPIEAQLFDRVIPNETRSASHKNGHGPCSIFQLDRRLVIALLMHEVHTS
ncbi:hypothetical protein D3C76_1163600 [compost metagenome]